MEKNILWQFQDDLISKRDGKQILLQEVITFSYPISTMLILFLLKGLFYREGKIGEHQKKKKKIQSWWTFNFGYYNSSSPQLAIRIFNFTFGSKVFEHLKKIEFNFTAISYYRSRIDPDVHIFKINRYFITLSNKYLRTNGILFNLPILLLFLFIILFIFL